MKTFRSLFVVAALLIVAAVPAFAGHGWSTYHWSLSCATCPKAITVIDTTTQTAYANWPDHLAKSVFGDPNNPNTANRGGWNDSAVLNLTVNRTGTGERKCSAVAGQVKVCNATYGKNGWLGLAQIWLSGGHISQGTSKMNDTYFNGTSYPITEQRHVMCQEIGHDFGLGHTSEDGTSQNTCMDYYGNKSNSDWQSTGPNTHDFEQLETQHHWGVSANGSNASIFSNYIPRSLSVPPMGDVELNEPWQWGTPVEFDSKGRAVTFLLKLGPNHEGEEQEIVTHIYPVREDEEEGRNIDRDRSK